jgi:hypothetical protein
MSEQLPRKTNLYGTQAVSCQLQTFRRSVQEINQPTGPFCELGTSVPTVQFMLSRLRNITCRARGVEEQRFGREVPGSNLGRTYTDMFLDFPQSLQTLSVAQNV